MRPPSWPNPDAPPPGLRLKCVYLKSDDTAVIHFTQAGHRENAVTAAIGVVREAAERDRKAAGDDWVMAALLAPMGPWLVEVMLQGAFMREWHEFEKSAKAFFNGNHVRNGGQAVDWRAKVPGISRPSMMDRVREQLALFGATAPAEALATIDGARLRVNRTKHEADDFVTEADYRALTAAIAEFWSAMAEQTETVVC